MPGRMRSQRFALLTTCAVTVLLVGAGSFFLYGFSASTLVRLLQGVAVFGLGVVIVVGAVVFAIVRLGNWQQGEAEFEKTVSHTERLAQLGWSGEGDDEYDMPDDADFDDALRGAIDLLPPESHHALEYVEIVVVDDDDELAAEKGRSTRLSEYGRYDKSSGNDEAFSDRVVLFRETLMRDFGHNEDLLRERIERTLRRGLAHRFNAGGRGRIGRRQH
jgi:predicted Zn-dependent protease with MMP-like domain